MTRGWWGLLTN
jgi:Small-conductance mechanosensitive channel